MRFTLTIDLGNEAMQNPDEIHGALKKVMGQVGDFTHFTDGDGNPVMDRNGNTVGKWEVRA